MRRLRLTQETGQLLFSVNSFEELAQLSSDVQLRPGTRFVLELVLRFPVGAAFDLPAAEAIFRPVTPPGLELLDVHSQGSNLAILEYRVVEVAEASTPGQAAMGVLPALAAIVAYIGANFGTIALWGIGILTSLAFLVGAIKGRGTPAQQVGDLVPDLKQVLLIGTILIGGLIALQVAQGVKK